MEQRHEHELIIARQDQRKRCCPGAPLAAAEGRPGLGSHLGEQDGRALRDEQEVRQHSVGSLVLVPGHQRLQRILDPLQHL